MQQNKKLALIGSLVLVGAVLILFLVFLGAAPLFISAPSDVRPDYRPIPETSGVPEQPVQDSGTTDGQRAEEALGVALPSDASVSTLIDGEDAVGTVGSTVLSLEDTRVWIDAEISVLGGTITRSWGRLPTDNDTRTSAVYAVQGETWSVILTATDTGTTFDITRQY